jgi:hypothetical protein
VPSASGRSTGVAGYPPKGGELFLILTL